MKKERQDVIKAGDVIGGRYKIIKKIGQGGMSDIYLASDNQDGIYRAVKILRKTEGIVNRGIYRNVFVSEVNMMKHCVHPAFPKIIDNFEDDPYIIVMEYIEGESLDKVILKKGGQSEEKVIEWAKQLCYLLDYLHQQNPPVIYRDMKPSNIILESNGTLHLVDFGAARVYKADSITDTMIFGTRGYASPEQHCLRQTDCRADLFSLGMTLHHLLTGIDPRASGYMYTSVRNWNLSLSKRIEKIVDKCTAINPEDRYQNCNELLYDLEHIKDPENIFLEKGKKTWRMFRHMYQQLFLG